LSWFITFLFINATWVFFRAESFDRALVILKGMLSFDTIVLTQVIDSTQALIIFKADSVFDSPLYVLLFLLFWGGIAFFSRNTLQASGYMEQKKIRFTFSHSMIIGLVFFTLIILQVQNSPSQFLYFNF